MAEASKIEWTDATWNPVTGCTLVDEGCRNCYAADLACGRLRNHPSRAGLARRNAGGIAKFTGEVRLNDYWLDQPLKWQRPRMIFVSAHGDLFHENVPDIWIDLVFAVMAMCQRHKFQLLTKRPARAAEYLSRLQSRIYWGEIAVKARVARIALLADMSFLSQRDPGPLANVWLGTSVSDQQGAAQRIPHLLDAPAAMHFISAEPLLGPIDLCKWVHGIDWVIVGGESGKGARPMHPQWARGLRDQCRNAGIRFFFKQWGRFAPDGGKGGLRGGGNSIVLGADGDVRGIGSVSLCDDDVVMRPLPKRASGAVLDGESWTELPA